MKSWRTTSTHILLLAALVNFLCSRKSLELLARFRGETSSAQRMLYEDFPDLKVGVSPETGFVLVIEPRDPERLLDSKWLVNFLSKETAWIKKVFFAHGAVLFRGFDVPNAKAFEDVALAAMPRLEKVYLGTSPRSMINGTQFVHTAADFNPHRTVPVHMEMSFRERPPQTQIFYANRVDQYIGGETPLVDFRGVWQSLSPKMKEKFGKAKVKYVRNNDDCSSSWNPDPLVQKCWQQMFKDRGDAITKCSAEAFNCTWDASNRLTIANLQPFVRRHPVTNEEVWFNHINVLLKDFMVYDYERTAVLWGGLQGWWPMMLAVYYRVLFAALGMVWPEENLGSTVKFEDGSSLTYEEIDEIKRATWENTAQSPYQIHDVLLLDNMRVGHGREIYLGAKESRSIFTAWSDLYPEAWKVGK